MPFFKNKFEFKHIRSKLIDLMQLNLLQKSLHFSKNKTIMELAIKLNTY